MAPDVNTELAQEQDLRTKGDVVGATRIISQLMLVYPDDPRVVGEYGKLLVQKKQASDAVQFLQRAIQLQPNDWTFYSALGVAYDQSSQPADAKLAYERALAMKPGEPAILNNYAMSRMLVGDTVSARRLLTQAKASGSTDPKIDSNLALLDRMTPATDALAAPAPVYAAAPRKPVARADAAPIIVQAPTAHGAPTPLTHGGVVMQTVPVDPLAGPVAHAAHDGKPAKLAKSGRTAPHVAATPEKKGKPADRIPALRMTADAGKP
ncbi:MAG TPA: tetratricopeptide repeat protein [Rhizomicrobium sp.]